MASQQVTLRSLGKPVLAAGQQQELERIRRENDAVLSVRRIGARTMTFDELWQTLPIPFGYEHMDELDKRRWQAIVEAAFRKGLFEGTHKSGSAKTADSKRISDLEAAVAEIRASILAGAKIYYQPAAVPPKVPSGNGLPHGGYQPTTSEAKPAPPPKKP